MMSELSMSADERRTFLAEPRVAVLAVQGPAGSAPIVGPIWYAYEPGGEVTMQIGADSQKAAALRLSPQLTLCSSDDALPYRFVSVSGTARLGPGDEDIRRSIAQRYLPAEFVEGYLASSAGGETLTVRFAPTAWRSNDFGRFGRTS